MNTINEMYLESLEWFKEMISSSTVSMFKERGELSPIFFALMPTRKKDRPLEMAVCPLDFGDKNMAAMFMTAFVKNYKPLATAFVSEMWFMNVEATPENKKQVLEDLKDIVPSEEPGRIEGVMVSLETYDMECMFIYRIDRTHEKASLELVHPGANEWKKTDLEAPKRFNAIYKKAGINWSQHLNDAFNFSDN